MTKQDAIIKASIERYARETAPQLFNRPMIEAERTVEYLRIYDYKTDTLSDLQQREFRVRVCFGNENSSFHVTADGEVFELVWSRNRDCYVGFPDTIQGLKTLIEAHLYKTCNSLLEQATRQQIELDRTWEQYEKALKNYESWLNAKEKGEL